MSMPDSIPTGVPLKSAKDLYLDHVLKSDRNLEYILCGPDERRNFHKAELQATMMIGDIVEEEDRIEIQKAFYAKMDIIEASKLTNDEKIKLVEIACAQVHTYLMRFLDEVLGVVRQNVIKNIAEKPPDDNS